MIVIHCGTNDIEEETKVGMEQAFMNIINDVLWQKVQSKIILSGIIQRLDKPYLNGRIQVMNNFLRTLECEQVSFLDHNPTFRELPKVLNNSGLHLRH